MTSGNKQQRDPVTLLTICVLWLAMGVFVLYPIVRLLAMTFIVDDHRIHFCLCGNASVASEMADFLYQRSHASAADFSPFHIKYCINALLGTQRHYFDCLRSGKL